MVILMLGQCFPAFSEEVTRLRAAALALRSRQSSVPHLRGKVRLFFFYQYSVNFFYFIGSFAKEGDEETKSMEVKTGECWGACAELVCARVMFTQVKTLTSLSLRDSTPTLAVR